MAEDKPGCFFCVTKIFTGRFFVHFLASVSILILVSIIVLNNNLTSLHEASRQFRNAIKGLMDEHSDFLSEAVTSRNKTAGGPNTPTVQKTTVSKSSSPPKGNDRKVARKATQNPTPRPELCESCFHHNFKYILNNEHICDVGNGKKEVEIIVFIFTEHSKLENRKAIRETWLTPTKSNTADIRYAFLLGYTFNANLQKQVETENSVHHDIIQEDFVDKYVNLTYKTMMAFKWASTKCSNAKFVMKTDDDMWVNLEAVRGVTKAHADSLKTSVGGMCYQTGAPHRNKNSKWYASYLSYPQKQYPGFCSGTGYITSMDVATNVFQISKDVPFFHLEDVYVAICVRKLGYRLKSIGGFNNARPAPGCSYKTPQIVTSHEISPQVMRSVWNQKC